MHKVKGTLLLTLCLVTLLSGCGASESATEQLSTEQVAQVEQLDNGYIKYLLNKKCNIDKSLPISTEGMQTEIFNSKKLGEYSYIDLFNDSDCIDVAGLIEFGTEPFYLHKDTVAKTVEMCWGPDKTRAIMGGNLYSRFYKVTSNYNDAHLSLYYNLCNAYLKDDSTLVLDISADDMIDVKTVDDVKAYVETRSNRELESLSVYRKDAVGLEDLRMKFESDTNTIKTTSWESDRIRLNIDELAYDDTVERVEFTEVSLPMLGGAQKSLVPSNIPINGVTMVFGADDTGAYTGKLDFEFICTEEQAAQLVQFYALYYPKAKLETNRITITEDNTVTVAVVDDKYKVLVYCRKNM